VSSSIATTSAVRVSVVSTTLVSVETFSSDTPPDVAARSIDDVETKQKLEEVEQEKQAPTPFKGTLFFLRAQ